VGLEEGRILLTTGDQFSISDDGGITWSELYQGKDDKGKPIAGHGSESLVNLSGGAIGLATLRSRPGFSDYYRTQSYGYELIFRASKDEGKTWSDPTVMSQGLASVYCFQDTMIRTESGRIILPVYLDIGQGLKSHQDGAPFLGAYYNGNFVSTDCHFYDPHFEASYILYSDDEGKTWQPNRDGELFIIREYGGSAENATEPSVVEVTPGRLLMIMRTRLGRLFQSWSQDNGETWSRPMPTQLAGTQAPGQIRKFPQTGHLLVVWTQQSEREIRQGLIRTRLSSAISRNQGGVWEHFQNVESLHEETHVEPGPIALVRPEGRYPMLPQTGSFECDPEYAVPLPQGYGMWAYPSVFVAEDRVLISHTYWTCDNTGEIVGAEGGKLKVLPISWFYGGEDPKRENTALKRALDW
jgi:hypothetical protein